MSAHDEAVEAARNALFDDHAERMGMPTRARNLTDEGLRAAVVAFEPRAKLAIAAYLRHMRAAGFVVTKAMPAVDCLDAPGRMPAGEALGWVAGFNACRAEMLANAVEVPE